MMTDDPPPEGGKAAKLMWSALDEELRREVEEEGQVIETRHLIVRRWRLSPHPTPRRTKDDES